MPGFELFSDLERDQVKEVLDTGVLMRYGFDGMRNEVWKVKELEQKVARRMQVKHAHALSSGHSSSNLGTGCRRSRRRRRGDHAACFTFVASFESIIALGAKPVLVDVDETLTLDPQSVKNAITGNTKAVMPVHMCGTMANLSALKDICIENNLVLIEDACQAIGGTYNGKPLGSIGDLGCFSFDFVKTVTCGEGGVVITNNGDHYENMHAYADHGHDHIGSDRGAEGHPFLGFNYRLSELNAAVGCAQFERLDDFIEIQKNNYTTLLDAISDLSYVQANPITAGGVGNYGFLNLLFDSEKQARAAQMQLKEAGVDVCFYWYDNNWHYYRKWEHLFEAKSLFPLSDELRTHLKQQAKKDFSLSDKTISRTLSCLIKLSWTAEEVEKKGNYYERGFIHFVVRLLFVYSFISSSYLPLTNLGFKMSG